MSRKKKWQSAELNSRQYRHYYDLLKMLACSVYKWEGLPPEIDERFLELTLFQTALAVFFNDPEFNAFFALRGSPSGQLNVYNNPTRYMVYGANGRFHRNLAANECVPIWANYLRQPMHNTIDLYARKLTDIDRTMDVNLAAQKTPVLITCTEEQRLTMLNLYKQYDGNEPVIFGYKIIDQAAAGGQPIQAIQTGAPYIVTDLLTDKARIWAEIMTYLGINNANQDKKERLVADEVSANDDQIQMCRLMNLNARRQACDQINRKYGLNVSVNYNTDWESANFGYVNDLAAQDGSDEADESGV